MQRFLWAHFRKISNLFDQQSIARPCNRDRHYRDLGFLHSFFVTMKLKYNTDLRPYLCKHKNVPVSLYFTIDSGDGSESIRFNFLISWSQDKQAGLKVLFMLS